MNEQTVLNAFEQALYYQYNRADKVRRAKNKIDILYIRKGIYDRQVHLFRQYLYERLGWIAKCNTCLLQLAENERLRD